MYQLHPTDPRAALSENLLHRVETGSVVVLDARFFELALHGAVAGTGTKLVLSLKHAQSAAALPFSLAIA